MTSVLPVPPYQPRMVFQILRTLKLMGAAMPHDDLEREFSQRGSAAFETALRYAVNEGWVAIDGPRGNVLLTRAGAAEERRTCAAAGAIILHIMTNQDQEWPLASAILATWYAVEARWTEQFESGVDYLQDERLLDFRTPPLAYALTKKGKAAAR